ncbi:MAG: hypothetical protein DMG34_15975 [Acidobacteria bacterium]|nr:MAG: hypothetical protein DMG34_15975 [Acidobacteriota bacterium]
MRPCPPQRAAVLRPAGDSCSAEFWRDAFARAAKREKKEKRFPARRQQQRESHRAAYRRTAARLHDFRGSYQALYKLQRSKMQQVRMDRSNTYIKVNGNTAWACFQWDFAAVIEGNPSAARGQTTYVFIKKDNRWLIAHDHTSIVQTAQPQAPAGTVPPGSTPPKPAN